MFTSDIAIFLLGLIAAIFGGYFGAAIGGNFAFALTGFMILVSWGIFVGSGSDIGFNYLAFGPVMGPHITFAAGCAAAAYAMHKGLIESGRDATSPLARLGRVDVLLVGAAFGAAAAKAIDVLGCGFHDADPELNKSKPSMGFASSGVVKTKGDKPRSAQYVPVSGQGQGVRQPPDHLAWQRSHPAACNVDVIAGHDPQSMPPDRRLKQPAN